ncbi:hypothetical protein ACRRTK_000379 [Alexandromys fortis]
MEVAPAQEGDGKDNKEIQKSSKLIPYLTTVPRSVATFKRLIAEKRLASSRPLKISDPKYIASLEGPFGLGPLVFPAFQRFNNIDFFLFLYCLTVMVHVLGNLLGLGHSTVNTSFWSPDTELMGR